MNIVYKAILFIPFLGIGQSTFLEAKSFYDNKEYSISENVLQSSLIDSPNDIKSLELLGSVYVIQENWEEATSLYKKLVLLDSTNAEYRYQYGKSLAMKAKSSNVFSAFMMIDEIEYEFLTAVSLDEKHIDAIWALVVFYNEIPGIFGGNSKKAITYSNQLEALSKVDFYLSKGYLYEDDNEFLLAEENYLKAIEVGGSINCYQKLISLYKNEKEYIKAIDYLEIANEKHKWNNFNFQLGKITVSNKIDLEKGEESLKRYINDYSSKDDISIEYAYYYLAKIFRYKNDSENALKWIRKSLQENPDFKEAINEEKLILKM